MYGRFVTNKNQKCIKGIEDDLKEAYQLISKVNGDYVDREGILDAFIKSGCLSIQNIHLDFIVMRLFMVCGSLDQLDYWKIFEIFNTKSVYNRSKDVTNNDDFLDEMDNVDFDELDGDFGDLDDDL